MTVNEAHLIYFSPTHTSKQVAEAIVHGTGIKNILPVNVTLQTTGEAVIPASALAIIVVPVYGGRVAPLAMERLQNIRGLDTPTVLVVVYGNRAYEKALMELDAFALPHGLKVIAGELLSVSIHIVRMNIRLLPDVRMIRTWLWLRSSGKRS